MSTLRVALAQVNPQVGDILGNTEMVVRLAVQARDAGADLVAFPEMVVTGYPTEDLSLRASFVDASVRATCDLARRLADAGCADMAVVVGYLDKAQGADTDIDGDGESEHGATGVPRGMPQNCAAVLSGGQVHGRYAKHHLPNYGVFDEFRHFVPGHSVTVARVAGVDIALAICEDIWQEGGPVSRVAELSAGMLLVLNGSPFERHKDDTRLQLVRRRAGQTGCAVAYVNMVGGQDDLVFDGDSIIVAADGAVLARAPQFDDHLLVCDVPCPEPAAATQTPNDLRVNRVHISDSPRVAQREPLAPAQPARLTDTAETYHALVVGLRDYVRKNGFSSVCLGLSGGIDSALVAALAADAIGGANIVGVSMPSEYSSRHSRDDAADLAARIGLDYRVIPIAAMVESFDKALGLSDTAAENIQARVRGMILMSISNAEGPLVLATGNKSEMSVGYSTIYGDSVGGFAPIKDVPKTLVWELARWRNDHVIAGLADPIPTASITKAPSAELRPGQKDSDSLPEYDVLDSILLRYVEQALGRDEIIADGFSAQTVDKVVGLVDRAEWKRRQSAPGVKISPVAFGRDRRLPVTSAWRENAPELLRRSPTA